MPPPYEGGSIITSSTESANHRHAQLRQLITPNPIRIVVIVYGDERKNTKNNCSIKIELLLVRHLHLKKIHENS